MIVLAVACLCLAAGDPAPSPADLVAYREARGKAGRDADAHVRLALWCEAHGLTAERLEHLAMAVAADPAHAAARGLLGLVDDAGRWRRADDVAARVREDAGRIGALQEYDTRRAQAPPTPDGQWRLALWCEQNGLNSEASAHYLAVTRLDPQRAAAWKKLGYRKVGNRWMTDAQVAAEKAEAEAQRRADKEWAASLATWKGWLGKAEKRAGAEAALARVDSPRAVPAVWKAFATGNAKEQGRAVQILGQIDAPSASRALAALAVLSESEEVRRAAVETLRRRDPREFAQALVQQVRKPLSYEVKPVDGPGSQGVLFVEGERYNLRRSYDAPAPPPLRRLFDESVPFGWTGDRAGLAEWLTSYETVMRDRAIAGIQGRTSWRGEMVKGGDSGFESGTLFSPSGATDLTAMAIHRDVRIALDRREAERVAGNAQQQLEADIAAVETENRAIRETNSRVVPILASVSGSDLGENPDAWRRWYIDQLGYTSVSQNQPKPTFDQQVPVEQPIFYGFKMRSCFAAGTPVRCLTGPRPIESLRVGDLVLAQSEATGALSYRPVVATHHNPPAPTFRVSLGGDEVVASAFHRFWVAGRGWKMARDLRSGDPIRTLGGVIEVTAVAAERVQPVFNLDVAEDRTFFAGKRAALVHDNSVPDFRARPFDLQPVLAAAPSR